MYRTILCILSMILLLQTIYAQENTEEYKKRVDIHINPLTVLDFTPRLRIGAEYQPLSSKFAYAFDIGYGNNLLSDLYNPNRIPGINYQFFEIRPELKYYISDPYNDFKLYTSIEVFGLQMTNTFIDNYYHSEETGNEIQFDRADFRKYKIGAHLKFGIALWTMKSFCMDSYIGIGAAYRNRDYFNIVNPVDLGDSRWYEWVPPSSYLFESDYAFFHLTAGLKFGYIIR